MPEKTVTERVATLEAVIPTICDDINEIKNNHIAHIQADMQEMSRCLSSMKRDSVAVKTDVAWLKRFFWVIATASISSLVAQIATFI